mmetsp:Transcript_16518/g.41800  ORF Transcript_16518/g.41800 Transcript_16518/m.41800 type:complete len:80 (-) Transcript_16518:565-804(-)
MAHSRDAMEGVRSAADCGGDSFLVILLTVHAGSETLIAHSAALMVSSNNARDHVVPSPIRSVALVARFSDGSMYLDSSC